jgi:gluconolactonase
LGRRVGFSGNISYLHRENLKPTQMTIHTLIVAAALAAPAAALSQGAGIVAPGARLTLVAEGFSFTEGPAADGAGNVFFTDQPRDRIMRWDAADGTVTEFLSPSGRANGLWFSSDGSLLAAADGLNALWRIAPDGSHTELTRGFGGGELNGPNDLWEHPEGGIYFTDPLYARDYWTHRTAETQQDGQHVYYLAPKSKRAVRVTRDLEQPNGIIGTPDGRTLYVADIGANKTYAYDIARSCKLKNKRLFAPMGSDGMTRDEAGNIYLTGRGVTVFNPAGEQIEHIEVPEGWTANVTFGGRDRDVLFITASDAVYTLKMNVKAE